MKAGAIKFIDTFLGIPIIFLLLFIGPFRRKPAEIKKILVIMFWGIGSNITAFPAVKSLDKRFPKAEITVLGPEKNKDLFYNNANIDNLIFINLGFFPLLKLLLKIRNKYDVVIDTEHWLNVSSIISFIAGKQRIGFSNKLRSLLYTDKIAFDNKKHSVENNLNLVGILGAGQSEKKLEKIHTKDSDRQFAINFLIKNQIQNQDLIIGICPGSGPTVTERRWPKERFAELAENLIEKNNAKIIFFGSKDEEPLIRSIQLLMKNKATYATDIGLGQLIELVGKCSLFISNDTGPMHIAAAQGIKTIGLFGPETPQIFAPYGNGNFSFFKKTECSPCIKIYEGRHIKCFNSQKCMKLITVDEVYRAADKLIR